ncbi:hypothetical protein HFN65_17365 [Rhizobium laguerreae]|nr:hypothetical protein [Rhizobium laguerreae]MBY3500606.1 hypothetical protein [Rhizobium laguerreae]MBY3572757.1 hypothetical protein [Rhizobium laguerreae]TBY14493.1 hypothetical protein E0I94_03010 [Rhizobium laguerreae]
MAPHRNPPLPNQQQQPKTAGANSKLDKTGGKVIGLPGVTGAVSWKRFKDLVQQRTPSTALEILAAVERCVISAISPNEKLDNEQIFRSPKDGRINRMIITRQYTYYDGRVTLHMYIIDLLDLGFAIDENTETILTYISIPLKFRSLFLKWGATYSVQEFETISRDRTETVHFIRKFMQQLAIIEEESRIFSLDELQKIKIYSGKLSGKILGENMRLWEERCQALRDASAAMLNLNVEAEFSERAEQLAAGAGELCRADGSSQPRIRPASYQATIEILPADEGRKRRLALGGPTGQFRTASGHESLGYGHPVSRLDWPAKQEG